MQEIIPIASDHAGYELKLKVIDHLRQRGIDVRDFGTNSTDSCDYPDFAHLVVSADTALAILDQFLDTPFEGGRHTRRVEKISQLLN